MDDSFAIVNDITKELILAKANFPINLIDIQGTRIVVLCMLSQKPDGTTRFSLQFDNPYSDEIKNAVLDRIIGYVGTFHIKYDYFIIGFDTPVQTINLLSSFHNDKYTKSDNRTVYDTMQRVLSTNKYDDYVFIKYLNNICVSTTFKIPDVDDEIRLRVCDGDVLCIANKQIIIHNRMLGLTDQKENGLVCVLHHLMIKHLVQLIGRKEIQSFVVNSAKRGI